MKTKSINKIIAAVVMAGILTGVTGCSLNKKDDRNEKQPTKGPVSVNDLTDNDTSGPVSVNNHTDIDTTDPEDVKDVMGEEKEKPVTGDSILLRLDGMTTDEIVENLWKATHVKEGMYSEDFYENIVIDGCELFENKKKDDDFSWFFYEGSSDTIRYISRISVFSGMKCDPVFDGSGRVVLELHIEEKEYAFEVAEAIVERIQSNGYDIHLDRKSGENEDTWYVSFQKDRMTCTLQVNNVADYVISFDFPIDGMDQSTETSEEKAVPTESEDPYAKYDLPLDDLSDQEIFDFCHRTLTLELIDGESSEDLEKRLPSVVEMGKYPYSVSMDSNLDYGYGTPLDSGICMTEVSFCCNCDYVKDVITNLTPEDTNGVMDRLTSVTIRITNGRCEELYEYFKEQYAAMYPGTEIKYLKDEYDNWFDFRMETEDGMFAHARITHFRDGHDELYIEEAHLIVD